MNDRKRMKKAREKRIEAIEKQIEKHEEKIESEKGRQYSPSCEADSSFMEKRN